MHHISDLAVHFVFYQSRCKLCLLLPLFSQFALVVIVIICLFKIGVGLVASDIFQWFSCCYALKLIILLLKLLVYVFFVGGARFLSRSCCLLNSGFNVDFQLSFNSVFEWI